MMEKGIILKGVGGLYTISTAHGTYSCKARGIFRKDNEKPMVGDRVEISVLSEEKGEGVIESLLPRETFLIRPPVANITRLFVVISASKPKVQTLLLDKMLVAAEFNGIEPILVINKSDMWEDFMTPLEAIYRSAGYQVYRTSAEERTGLEPLMEAMEGHISAFAGVSGVGKSSLLNALYSFLDLETGGISRKTARGKHTTRHVELFPIDSDSWVLDTPGFSLMDITHIPLEDLDHCFREFRKDEKRCQFTSCSHIKEKGCIIREGVEKGTISRERYENYVYMYNEIEKARRY